MLSLARYTFNLVVLRPYFLYFAIAILILLNLHSLLSNTFLKEVNAQTKKGASWSGPFFTSAAKTNSNFIWDARDICDEVKETDLSMVIVIHSARANFERRKLIRETWGSIRSYGRWSISKIAFMVGDSGAPDENPLVASMLEDEFRVHGDLVKRHFVDIYKNLLVKAIMAYEWVVEFCSHVKVMVKTDDDCLTNIFQLTRSLNELNPNEFLELKKVYGFLLGKSIKENVQKNGGGNPVYATGGAYVITMEGVKTILDTRKSYKGRIQSEDIFLTGTLPRLFNSWNSNGNDLIENSTADAKTGTLKKQFYHVQKRYDWYFVPVFREGNDAEFREWTAASQEGQSGINGTVDQSLKRNFVSKIFYIITHGVPFYQDFSSGWNKIIQIEGRRMKTR